MKLFKAIRGSILPNALNIRFRSIVEAVNEIITRIEALEAGTSAVTVQTDELPAEAMSITDEKSPDYPVRVEAKAKGVTSWHVKSIDTLTAELAELKSEG